MRTRTSGGVGGNGRGKARSSLPDFDVRIRPKERNAVPVEPFAGGGEPDDIVSGWTRVSRHAIRTALEEIFVRTGDPPTLRNRAQGAGANGRPRRGSRFEETMSRFNVHTLETAPAASKEHLATAKAAFGFVPNLIGVLAASPSAAQAYLVLGDLMSKTSLTAVEREVVLLAASRTNTCGYCMAAHSTVAQGAKMPEAVLSALRAGEVLPDEKLEALRRFTVALVEQRGHVDSDGVSAFLAAGYTEANVLDVVLGTTMKTLSNYTNNVAHTPVDAAFQRWNWTSKP